MDFFAAAFPEDCAALVLVVLPSEDLDADLVLAIVQHFERTRVPIPIYKKRLLLQCARSTLLLDTQRHHTICPVEDVQRYVNCAVMKPCSSRV